VRYGHLVILVTGASGFVGRHVVHTLTARGIRVRAMVRGAAGAARLADVDCELVRGEMTEPESLRAATVGCHSIVHLVSRLSGSTDEIDRVMVRGTNDLVAAARAAGIRKLVLMSALGTSERTAERAPYYRAKWSMEEAVRRSGIAHVVLRPSLVFGADGGALPRLVRLASLAPLTPTLGRGTQRIQPIWVDDVAAAVALAVGSADDAVVELGGPDVVSWRELMHTIHAVRGSAKPLLRIPSRLARATVAVLEHLPGAPITRAELALIELGDNVLTDDGKSMAELGLPPRVPLAEQLERAARSGAAT
jgi:uncharacterized protein YbjT (DUF2867 family)